MWILTERDEMVNAENISKIIIQDWTCHGKTTHCVVKAFLVDNETADLIEVDTLEIAQLCLQAIAEWNDIAGHLTLDLRENGTHRKCVLAGSFEKYGDKNVDSD